MIYDSLEKQLQLDAMEKHSQNNTHLPLTRLQSKTASHDSP